MIPGELTKPIDEIKTPSNRILIIGMILIIMALTSAVVWQWRKKNSDCDDTKAENARLNKWKFDHLEEDNQRLTKRNEYFDSMMQLSKKLLKDTQ